MNNFIEKKIKQKIKPLCGLSKIVSVVADPCSLMNKYPFYLNDQCLNKQNLWNTRRKIKYLSRYMQLFCNLLVKNYHT